MYFNYQISQFRPNSQLWPNFLGLKPEACHPTCAYSKLCELIFLKIDSSFSIDWLRSRLIPLLIIAFTFVSSQQVSILSVFLASSEILVSILARSYFHQCNVGVACWVHRYTHSHSICGRWDLGGVMIENRCTQQKLGISNMYARFHKREAGGMGG